MHVYKGNYNIISEVFYSVPPNAIIIILCIRETQNECQFLKIYIGEGVFHHCVIVHRRCINVF